MKNFSYPEGKPERKTEELYVETVDEKPPNRDGNAGNPKEIFTPSTKGCAELRWKKPPDFEGEKPKRVDNQGLTTGKDCRGLQRAREKGFPSRLNKTKRKVQFFLVRLLALLALDDRLRFYSVVGASGLTVGLAASTGVSLSFECLGFEPRAQTSSPVSDRKS